MKEPLLFQMSSSSHIRCAKVDDAQVAGLVCAGPDDVEDLSHPVDVPVKALGREWMDFLSMNSSASPFLCSEKVLQAIRQENLTGYRAMPVRLLPPHGKKMTVPGPYYWLIATGRELKFRWFVYRNAGKEWRFEFEYTPENESRLSDLRDKYEYWEVRQRWQPVMDSWDGSDFINWGDGGGFGTMRCSRKVLDLAAREKWTNIEFGVFDAVASGYINHQTAWPPEKWYAESEPDWQKYPETQQAQSD